MSDRVRFPLDWTARVSAEFGVETYTSDRVTLRTNEDNAWQVEMNPSAARRLARQLTRAARMLEPPKPKK